MTVSLVRDAEDRFLYVVSQVQDISERKELARRLEYLIDHDFLTGLFNRRRFEQELSREAERAARYGAPAAVLEIDMDNFKDVNDTFGHKAGDDLLKGVASASEASHAPDGPPGATRRRRVRRASSRRPMPTRPRSWPTGQSRP